MTEIDHVYQNDLFCADLLEANFFIHSVNYITKIQRA
jgi:hypothetical protein